MVELVVVGLLLLLPLIALVVVVSREQAAAFAVDAGARSAALAVAGGGGQGAAEAATSLALADQGLDGPAEVVVTCDPVACDAPGARVGVEVRYRPEVVLPAVLGAALPAREPLEATATATVDRFAPAPEGER